MDYVKNEMGSYNLHFIKTNKFKTITVKIIFRRLAKKEEITMRNVLADLLLRSSHKYHTERLLAIADEELYGMSYSGGAILSGHYNMLSFDFSFLNEKYTEEGMNEKSFSFIFDMLFDPHIENKKFCTENLNLSKEFIRKNIESLKEEPRRYSLNKLCLEMASDSPLSYQIDGYMEDIDKITEEKLYTYYQDVIKKDLVDIFVIGDFADYKIKRYIEKKFPIHTFKKTAHSHYIKDNKIRMRVKNAKESSSFNQSQLLIGCNIIKPTFYELNYVSYIYNMILGGGSDSKLFRVVREKNSLCYDIASIRYLLNEVLVIRSGIRATHAKKAIALIKKEMKNIVNGKFTDDDITKAKTIYISGLKGIDDNPMSILNMYVSKEFLGLDLPYERIEKIGKVTKKQIIGFAKKIKWNTTYLLEGESSYE